MGTKCAIEGPKTPEKTPSDDLAARPPSGHVTAVFVAIVPNYHLPMPRNLTVKIFFQIP
jgi:hypothetical protein